MCGIIGIISKNDVSEPLIDGLKRLEYRGYDSAGIATLNGNEIYRQRAEGKIKNLQAIQNESPISGNIGIGHTRWATHGAPTTNNAHPHATANVAVVHNGIIENFLLLRKELQEKGMVFDTDTDTEVIPKLITHNIEQGDSFRQAVINTVKRLHGAFSLGIICKDNENTLYAVKQGSPLAVGFGEDEMFIGSDALALAPLTSTIAYLVDGDIAEITCEGVNIIDAKGAPTVREQVRIAPADMQTAKGHYRHYMLKEIYEQPSVIGTTLNSFFHPVTGEITLPDLPFDLADISKVSIVACGTSFYAGSVAKYWIEKIARVPVELDIASEYRYRSPIFEKNGLIIVISQSGETADTLAALRFAKENGQNSIAVINVTESTMAREADAYLHTLAGPEIGVASTKAFTTQLVALASFTMALAASKNILPREELRTLGSSLAEVTSRALEVLNHDEAIKELSHELSMAQDILYVGRGTSYPIAMEGALKLKEISYIHAEATAAGELKHGPISLVDDNVPIIAIAPSDELFDKTASNIREIAARGGKIILLSDKKGISQLEDVTHYSIELPDAAPFASPILYSIPIQLIAYHVAVAKGTDVDQPRNLAKSVTVE
jgi:glucosamine--fructose-6-phosphate aminotransferase (isomerizing)